MVGGEEDEDDMSTVVSSLGYGRGSDGVGFFACRCCSHITTLATTPQLGGQIDQARSDPRAALQCKQCRRRGLRFRPLQI
jgi:hypothetical protein